MADKKQEITEFKSDDDQSILPEPIGTGDKKRPADQHNGQPPAQFATKVEAMSAAVSAFSGLTKLQISDYLAGLDKSKNKRPLDKDTKILPKASAMAKEDVDEIFGDAELSEEIKERITTVFEAAVNARTTVEIVRLEESFETRLTEAVEEIRTELAEGVDTYLSYTADKWLEENQVEVQNGLKVQLAENFLNSMIGLLTENSVVLPEKIELVTDLTTKIEEADKRLAESLEIQAKQAAEIKEYRLAESFLNVSEGLTVTQADKLEQLAEGMTFDTAEEYESKLTTIKESLFGGEKSPASAAVLNEAEVLTEEKVAATNTAMAGYTSRLSRQSRS